MNKNSVIIIISISFTFFLIASDKKQSLKDNNEYWTITEEGKSIFKAVRKNMIETNLQFLNEDKNIGLDDAGSL